MTCRYRYEDHELCGLPVTAKPDKNKGSYYVRCEPQSKSEAYYESFAFIYPLKKVSNFCFYHDRVMSGRIEVHEPRHKTHARKLRETQKKEKRFKVFTKVPIHLQ